MKTFFNDHSEQEDVENEGNNQKKNNFFRELFWNGEKKLIAKQIWEFCRS